MPKKILVIKLGAKGDVVRTLPILLALKEKYPDSEIHWITKKDSEEIVKSSPYISKVYAFPEEINEVFDILYNFDIEKEATQIAEQLKADKKYGFCMQGDYPSSFNPSAEYYLSTLFDDEIKKSNKKTYQQIMFETAELPYKKQYHPIYLTEQEKKYGEEFAEQNKINREKLIGIHMGASSRWPSKVWHKEKLKEFIIIAKQKGYEILVFAGPNESQKQTKFSKELLNQGIKIHLNNPANTDREFVSLVNLCNKMICSDSFSLHISLALKKPTIGLFFCTPPNEVEDYGILKKLVSPSLYDFFPEKCNEYSEELTKSISSEEVLKAVEELK